jgi:CubicO group peptidase (beta-lactamase class C family)
VADYWPEFAQAGKGAVTVRQLLGHQAGLPVIKPPLTLADIADPEKLSKRIAAQAPLWPPGTRHGYHAVTLGWYESELIRHADPQGRTLGRYFAEEIAAPLDLDFYIGLPASVDRNRAALIHPFAMRNALLNLNTMPPRTAAAFVNPFSLVMRATTPAADVKGLDELNRDTLRVLEMPGVNGMGTAVGRQALWQRRNRWIRPGLEPHRPRRIGRPCGATDDGSARQGDALRHVVLARARQTYVHLCVRLVGPCLRMAGSRWFVRIRRSGDRHRIRICDEQHALCHA